LIKKSKDSDSDDIFSFKIQKETRQVATINKHMELPEKKVIQLDIEQKKKFMDSSSEQFYSHMVRPTDTVIGLSLKYGCTTNEIKKLNKFNRDNELYGFSQIKIPRKVNIVVEENEITEEDIELRKRQLIQRLIKNHSISQEVAKYYLEMNDYDYRKACEEYNEDLEWEINNGSKLKKKMHVESKENKGKKLSKSSSEKHSKLDKIKKRKKSKK